jgi:hypothetical protein
VYQILKRQREDQIVANNASGESTKQLVAHDYWDVAHTAINICLFPPLFFFSGLYYTDIASLLFVLLSYHANLLAIQGKGSRLGLAALQLFYGIGALLFRQTNIFWVGIFPIGLNALVISGNSPQVSKSSNNGIYLEGECHDVIR